MPSKRDCVIRAIAAGTGQPYEVVRTALIEYGASPYCERVGIWPRVYRAYLADHGWIWTPTMGIGTGCRVHLKADDLPPGRLIVRVSRHLVAVQDGRVISDAFDPTRNGSRCVYGYWHQ